METRGPKKRAGPGKSYGGVSGRTADGSSFGGRLDLDPSHTLQQEGNAQAVALVLLRREQEGKLPLKTLKEKTAAFLLQLDPGGGAAAVDGRVLEAVYALSSSSLLSIDRSSPEQTVSVSTNLA